MQGKNNLKAWLYLLPAIILLGFFMVYPLIDVFIYSFEENYNSVSQQFTGYGFYNYYYVLHDEYFIKAIKNTFILVVITVPLSTVISILLAAALNSIKKLKSFLQSLYFLPYITNTIAVGLTFMILFDKNMNSIGFVNMILSIFRIDPIDFIDGPYWAKMFVLCFYTIWIVMPFKVLILTTALANVDKTYYQAAKVDGANDKRIFFKITLPLISPIIFYLVITGFIGAFKAYNDAVALFGVDLDSQGMNTMVGYVYNMLYRDNGGYPSYASAAAIILFVIILTITIINLIRRKRMSF